LRKKIEIFWQIKCVQMQIRSVQKIQQRFYVFVFSFRIELFFGSSPENAIKNKNLVSSLTSKIHVRSRTLGTVLVFERKV